MSIYLLFAVSFAFSQSVSLENAKQIAANHRQQMQPGTSSTLASAYTQTHEGKAVYYILNYKEGGFVIVSADKKAKPIIGYSFRNRFETPSANPALNAWMKRYETEIYLAEQSEQAAPSSTLQMWKRLADNQPAVQQKAGTGMEPLLTSHWGQSTYYNWLCPLDNDSHFDLRAPTGCVATSMAQIIYYHRYPKTGNGSSSYTSPYGKLTANYANANYDYNAMADVATNYSGALGTLMSHVGISLEMKYGTSGSSSNGSKMPNAFKKYFNYATSIQYAERKNYDSTGWKNLIISQLDQRLPVVYEGMPSKGGAGHSWVCDGYDVSGLFHMNWGWDGSADGYYDIDALTNVKISEGNYADLDDDHAIVCNIIPKEISFPKHDTLTATYGSFVDGSGYLPYANNESRSWLIMPPHATSITLTCAFFMTDTNDVVTIYDGTSTEDAVLATYSGNAIAGKSITINQPGVLITFTSDNDITGEGFTFNYTTTSSNPNYCNTTQSINNTNKISDAQGTVNNGSDGESYANDNVCWWRIEPKDAEKVWISFDKFDMEEGDYLYVYSYPTFNPRVMVGSTYLAATYSKENPPTLDKLNVFNNSWIYIKFHTDNNHSGSGWSFKFGNNVSVEEVESGISACTVYPNPAQEVLNIDLRLVDSDNQINIRLNDVLGREVYHATIASGNEVSHQISTNELANGCYILSIQTSHGKICRKVQVNN